MALSHADPVAHDSVVISTFLPYQRLARLLRTGARPPRGSLLFPLSLRERAG